MDSPQTSGDWFYLRNASRVSKGKRIVPYYLMLISNLFIDLIFQFLLSNPELFPKADFSIISEAMKDLFSKNLVQLNGDEWK